MNGKPLVYEVITVQIKSCLSLFLYCIFSSLNLSRRLVSLLKIQVGALSKILHSTNSATSFLGLRQYVDGLIKDVASVDENIPQDMVRMESMFKNVISAYEKLSKILGSTTAQSQLSGRSEQEFRNEINGLARELEQSQSENNERLQEQKNDFNQQIRRLNNLLEHEHVQNQRLQEQLLSVSEGNGDYRNNYESTIQQLKLQYEQDVSQLKQEFAAQFEEEKEATRITLQVFQRAHEEELAQLKESSVYNQRREMEYQNEQRNK